MGLITGSVVERHFRITPNTGEILYRTRGGNFSPAGYIKPGTVSSGGGYRIVSVPISYRKYKKVRAHHLIWCWQYGYWPKAEIDHVNGNRDDNRISNLREATAGQNRTNRATQTNNKSGFKSVYRCQTEFWRADVA